MQKSELHESSVAEEEHINIAYVPKREELVNQTRIKYATVSEIRSFERLSELYNEKLVETRPLLFSEQSLSSVLPMRFVSSNKQQSYTLGGRKQDAKDILQVQQDKLTMKLAVSNIRRENSFVLDIKNLKKRALIQLKTIQISNQENEVKFRYTMNLNDTNLQLRVLLQLEGEYKVWKEVEVPLNENKFTLEIHEYNNEQTDIRVNSFLFHLLLKMPYHEKINYCFQHEGNAQIQRVQFTSRPHKKEVQVKQTYCSKECQLI